MRPRDIQARIRAGASPEQVAEAAGVPVERIAAFAAPVIAERDYIAGLARTNPVRRRGETTSHRTLRNAVADALAARGVDSDAVEWDAWKIEDRRWQVRVAFRQADAEVEGLFVFDAMGRFSVAGNDEGRSLIGDAATDQLALVRATQGPADEDARADEPYAEDAVEPWTDSDYGDSEDAFHDGDLREVDGVYDIVAPASGDLDVLYDMLSSFDEDSVKIYAGLVHPKEASTPDAEGPVVVEVTEEIVAPEQAVVVDDDAVDEPEDEPTPGEEEAPTTPLPSVEPEQLSLIDEAAGPAPRPKPRGRRKRASVPSWDEIMFGAPRTEE